MKICGDLLGIVVQVLDLHLVNVGSVSTGPTHGEGRLQLNPDPVHVLTSTPKVRESPRSRLNLEGRLSYPPFFSVVKVYAQSVTPSSNVNLSTPQKTTSGE